MCSYSSPGKSALGKGWGAWGEGKPLPRWRRGFPSPQQATNLKRFSFEKGNTRGGGTAPPGTSGEPSGKMPRLRPVFPSARGIPRVFPFGRF